MWTIPFSHKKTKPSCCSDLPSIIKLLSNIKMSLWICYCISFFFLYYSQCFTELLEANKSKTHHSDPFQAQQIPIYMQNDHRAFTQSAKWTVAEYWSWQIPDAHLQPHSQDPSSGIQRSTQLYEIEACKWPSGRSRVWGGQVNSFVMMTGGLRGQGTWGGKLSSRNL